MQRVDIDRLKNKKIALVLSGGVVKAAAWHLGVAQALDDLGLSFISNKTPTKTDLNISTYVGSSAGSLVSLYLACGYRPIDIIQSSIERNDSVLRPISYTDMLSFSNVKKKPPRSADVHPLEGVPFIFKQAFNIFFSVSGLFTTKGLYNYIKKYLLQELVHFEDFVADLFIVATQLDHSRKVVFSKYNYPNPGHDLTAFYYKHTPVADAVAASMSVPPLYSPYPINNPVTGHTEYYIDGEIRDTLSTHVAKDNKCDFIISSWTHTPYHYHEEIGSLVNYGLPAICLQSILLMIQKKIVTARAQNSTAADVIKTIHEYMKNQRFPEKDIRNILSILETKLEYNKNVHYIDIYPKHENYNLFFRNNFSLDPKSTSSIVSAAYQRTIEVFNNHEWES
ncbi:MAG: patatin-like phospholipase family protein [Halobacteriovoraceae bacterium]|nr:patatin-like phospholipase family protein [Halobacteriovoraceae bacterium]